MKKHYYDLNFIDAENIKIPNNEELAIMSHYFHNKGTTYAEKFENDALNLYNSSLERDSISKDGIVSEPIEQYDLFKELFLAPFLPNDNPSFTFIDLFAGIGGFRMALQNLGGKCVFSSEWDINAQRTYFFNYGEMPFGDITKDEIKKYIPDNFDILCAGFPCQAFSIAGYRRGFEDTRGTLFFDVAQILKEKRPKALLLENVKNLHTHDKGNTFKTIVRTLEELGYIVFSKVLNTMEYANIPQNRERIFIVGFDKEQVHNYGGYKFPSKVKLTRTIHDCIDYTVDDESLFYRETSKYYPYLKEAMINNDTIYQWRRQYVRENQSNVCPTLTANMGMGGHNVPLIITPKGFRKLTPYECLSFQGYPTKYSFPTTIAKGQMYKQVGNSVTVPLVQSVAKNMIGLL